MSVSRIIKIKTSDKKQATIKNLSQSAWAAKRAGRSTKEQVHVNQRLKKPKHKQALENLEY